MYYSKVFIVHTNLYNLTIFRILPMNTLTEQVIYITLYLLELIQSYNLIWGSRQLLF